MREALAESMADNERRMADNEKRNEKRHEETMKALGRLAPSQLDTVVTIGDNSCTAVATVSLVPGSESTDTTQVREWNIGDVAKWLRAISLDHYSDSFRESEVDGKVLRWLNNDNLRTDLGVENAIHRQKILCGIDELMGMHPPKTATGGTPGTN